ncbi:MAG TPA: YdeI/OmpD-associated family protein [Acidobacteriaceae bacterium]
MLAGMKAPQRFKAVLERDGTGLGWTIVRVPFDPTRVWPQRQRLRVKGTINGFAFQTSLFRARQGHFILLVNKRMQKGGGLSLGSVADVTLEPDTDERTVALPPELEKVLRQDRALRRWHAALSDSYRKAIADRVTEAKSPAVRVKRAEQMAEWMMLAMEGERETPPILQAAFQRSPKARDAWQAMTPTQRRGQLLGIFYSQSPEARQKRTQKAIEEALRLAEKRANRGGSPGRR